MSAIISETSSPTVLATGAFFTLKTFCPLTSETSNAISGAVSAFPMVLLLCLIWLVGGWKFARSEIAPCCRFIEEHSCFAGGAAMGYAQCRQSVMNLFRLRPG